MPITSFANGTQTAVISTEHTLSGVNVAGIYQLAIDLINMASGDILELRVYQTVLVGGTNQKSVLYNFYGLQDTDFVTFSSDVFNNPLTDTNSLKFTLKQTAGTGRNFPWSVNSLAVQPYDANVTKWNGTAVATPVTAGIPTVALTTSQIVVRKNVALSSFSFLMIDSTDHFTPKTGLTVTAQRSIDGAAFAACANAVTELSSGFYLINLAATDLNGTVISLKFTATGADQRSLSILTQA